MYPSLPQCGGSRLRHFVAGSALAACALLLTPVGATAAELVAEAPAVTVPSGQVAALELSLSATGTMDCVARENRPGAAVVATSYSLVAGQWASTSPSAPRPFYSDWTPATRPPAECNVTWPGRPEPLRVPITIAVAPGTVAGDYSVPIATTVTNPGGTSHAPLADEKPSAIAVRVTQSDEPPPPPPPPPPAPAVVTKVEPQPPVKPGPRENISFNLEGVRGSVKARYPGTRRYRPVVEGQQVPPGTSLDTRRGSVKLLADRDGAGRVQEARFWAGVFALRYTRQVTPGVRSRRRSRAPITELRLPNDIGSCPRAGISRDVSSSRRRKRRRLWGRGRGRYRTRGRHGAGSVRGTHWFSENTCAGTLFKVRSGRVAIRDFTIRRTVTLRRGQRYLARPRGRGRSTG